MATLPRIPGEVLDYYLGQGYYRMQQDLFTCRFLPRGHTLHTVHWLRVLLPLVRYGARQRQLLRQNSHFAVAVRPLPAISAEHEALYARYHASLDFDTAPTLAGLLLGEGSSGHNVFSSYVVEVRDAGRLVAAGVLDRGADSIAGIVNFYDPDYRKYSLGKYLLLQKTEYARREGLACYYPGYLVHGYPKFDYKLFACEAATEVYDCLADAWHPFSWSEVARQAAAIAAARYLDNE